MSLSRSIAPAAPFNFSAMLQRPLSRPSKLAIVDPNVPSYVRAVRLGAKTVPIQVLSQGTVDKPSLEVYMPDDLTSDEQTQCVALVRNIFSTDVDITGFIAQMSADAAWAPLLERFRGLRPILDGSLFECMVKAIVGQQLNVQFAATLVERLVDLVGETVDWNGQPLPVFPSPAQVANLSYEELRGLSYSQRKAEYVIDFARLVAAGEVDLEALRQLPDEDVIRVLSAVRGVGRWTVECLLLFGLGRPDVLPAADIGVQNGVERLYQLDVRPKEPELRAMAEKWAPWRSYATYYLWNSLIKPAQA